jgi:hypothetical protein
MVAPPAPAPAARKDPFGLGAPPAPAPEADLETPVEEDWSDLGQPAAKAAPPPPPPALEVPEPEPAMGFDAEPPAPAPASIDLPEEPLEEPELAPMHAFVPPAETVGHRPAAAPAAAPSPMDGGEALLRDALSKASRDVIERIVWEVVPQLAETIIRENLDRLVKERQS